jgi:23S rRNA pseudoU1915 N3-methylase RlmH
MPIIENIDPLEPRLDPDRGLLQPEHVPVAGGDIVAEPKDKAFDDTELLAFLGEAKRLSRTYQQMTVMSDWERSQTAYRSEHSSGSKYLKDQYKNRAKYFKPKTRAAVRKNLTATANALFSSQDVMSCEAENDGDVLQRANASLVKEVINARFNSQSVRSSVPWFQLALGARLDTQVTGVCCSKQTWRYRCREKTVPSQEERPVTVAGNSLFDADGQPMMEVVDTTKTVKDVLEDKPLITLIPAENVLIDASTSWINPAQNSPTLIIIWPMHVDDVKAMMKDDDKNPTPWRTISDETLAGAYYSEQEVMGLKMARDGNAPQTNRSTSRFGGNRNEIAEVRENFFRKDGVDYQCWTLKETAMLSDAVPVEEVYPAHRGTRPVVIGSDILEPHVLYPESHVASWRQSQDEINDFANLRMDATRQSVFPTAKVKAGKNIDYKAVQRRDGQGIILVKDQEDVMWDRPPGAPAGAYQESNLLNNDFDELAGIFSQNSVQSNRQLNETVGGMQIMSANANATSEFDLRCFIVTWVEPVLSQIVFLEQYYEDDATLLAVSGEKAKLFERFGVNEITDELLESQIQMSVSVGIGSSDPMQQLAKFKTVLGLAMPMLTLAMQQGKAELNFEEIFAEIFGKAGYRNGSDRFIKMNQDGQAQIPPEKVKELMQMLQKMQQENQQLQQALKDKNQGKAMEVQAKAKTDMAQIVANSKSDWDSALLDFLKSTQVAEINAGASNNAAAMDVVVEGLLHLLGTMPEAPPPAMPAAPQLPPELEALLAGMSPTQAPAF